MHRYLSILILCLPLLLPAQEEEMPQAPVDSLYREDQYYIGGNFNVLTNRPDGVSNAGLLGGVFAGFLRDMPLNKQRNIAVAAGLGYAYNYSSYNLFVGENTAGEIEYIALNSDYRYSRNRFVTHEVELPIELRWRTSTASEYKFWRIYAGIKLGYVYYYSSKYSSRNGDILTADIPHFNRFRAGLTLNFGWNTFNFHLYYALQPFFNEDATMDGQAVDVIPLRVGLIFYIL